MNARSSSSLIEVAITIAGVVLAGLTVRGMRGSEHDQARLAFEAEAREHATHIEQGILRFSYILQSYQEAQRMTGGLARSAFEDLTAAAAKRHPGIVGAVYVPIVPGEARSRVEMSARRDGLDEFRFRLADGSIAPEQASYRPELYIVPAPDARGHGRDRSADATFMAVSAASTDSGAPRALPTTTAEEGRRVAALVAPIFEPDGPTFVRVGRRASVVGHVILRFDPSVVFAETVASSLDEGVIARLRIEDGPVLAGSFDGAFDQASRYLRKLPYEGEAWVFEVAPTPSYFALRSSVTPWAAGISVLLASALLTFLFWQQRVQRAEVERQVAERTSELAARTKDMRRVLDHVSSGLLTIDEDGRMMAEASAAVERWFGPRSEETDVATYLGRFDSVAAGYLAIGLEELREDFMPREVVLAQLPRSFSDGQQTFRVDYTPFEDDSGKKLLVVFSDVTAQLEAETRQAAQAELIAVFDKIMSDRDGFLDFFAETSRLIADLLEKRSADIRGLARDLHTVKGNCGLFGLTTIADVVHEIEDRMTEEGGPPTDAELSRLGQRWTELGEDLKRFLGESDAQVIELSEREYRTVLRAVLEDYDSEEVRRLVESWRNEPVAKQFGRIETRARALAQRLGKGDIRVLTRHHDLRLPKEPFAPFWSSLAHVVRNALDHGLESPEQRAAAGKSEQATLSLSASMADDVVVIEVSDDGRGIDFDKLVAKAEARGVVYTEPEELLFLDGLSSRDEVNSISGRGVGMAAVRASVERAGGAVEVATEMGRGTSFRFLFPRSEMSPHFASENVQPPACA